MSKTILWFPSNWPFIPARQQYFATAGYQPMLYDAALVDTADAILLSTPVWCGGEDWVSPETVWKNYFQERKPLIKILQAGWDNSAQVRNYLHWNRLPEGFETFLHESETAQTWTPHETNGDVLDVLWKKFRDGHDKGGFMDWFIVAQRRANMAVLKLEQDADAYAKMLEHLNLPSTVEAFDNLNKRWQRYRPLLAASPCENELEAIGQQVAIVSEGWAHCNNPTTLKDQMARFADAFKTIETQLQRMNAWF